MNNISVIADITETHKVFFEENKISDNLFIIRINNDSPRLAIRLYPLAIFEVPEDVDVSFLGDFQFSQEVIPFSFVQPLLIMTTKCNFRCTYCYAHEGTYGFAPQSMSELVLDKAIGYLRYVVMSRYANRSMRIDTTELGLICFGGEPTIEMPLIKKAYVELRNLCAEASDITGKAFKPVLTINTNGYRINSEMITFLAQSAPHLELVVSYDGVLHDSCRTDAAGNPTAARVLKNIRTLRANGIDVTVTCCVLPQVTASPRIFVDGLSPLYREGVAVNPSFIRGPLEGVADRAVYPGVLQESYRTEDLDQFGEVVAGEIAAGAPIYSRRYRRRLFEGGYLYRCGAGLFEFAVMPDGGVYPCHNFVAASSLLGNVLDEDFQLPEEHPLLRALVGRNVKNLTPCSECVFQSSCMSSFDCPAHSLHDLGDLNAVDSRFCGFARSVQAVIFADFIAEVQRAKQP